MLLEGRQDLLSPSYTIRIYTDNNSCSSQKKASVSLRFINASQGSPNVSLIVDEQNTIFTNVSFNNSGVPSYIQTCPNLYAFQVNNATTDAVLVTSLEFELFCKKVYTLVFVGIVGSNVFPPSLIVIKNKCHRC